MISFFFFFNDTATTEIYALSLHDALPIFAVVPGHVEVGLDEVAAGVVPVDARHFDDAHTGEAMRAPRPHGGDVAATDAGIADAGAVDLDTRLDHVAHRPDAHRLARARDLELGRGDA